MQQDNTASKMSSVFFAKDTQGHGHAWSYVARNSPREAQRRSTQLKALCEQCVGGKTCCISNHLCHSLTFCRYAFEHRWDIFAACFLQHWNLKHCTMIEAAHDDFVKLLPPGSLPLPQQRPMCFSDFGDTLPPWPMGIILHSDRDQSPQCS